MQIYKPSYSISGFRPQATEYYHRIQSANTANTIHSNRTIPQQTISSNRSQTRITTAKPIRSFVINKTMKSKPIEDEDFDQIIKTSHDQELFKFKHRCNAPQHLRMEQIYRFIYDKKTSNKQKYSMQSKINQQALPVASGSISIMLNVARKDYGFNLQSFKKKIAPKSKFKMKWKTIQWLLKNRKDAIRQIFQNYQSIVKQAKDFPDGLNKEQFQGLLISFGLGADKNLAEKLFYVFDEDSSGTVDYKELIVGLEVLKDDTIDEKLKIFFDLCDEDGSGKVSEKEIFNILKQNIINENDKYQLKMVIREMIKQVDQDGDGELNKEEILLAASKNPILRRLLEQTISNVRRIDAIIQNDLEEPFHQFVPSSANFITQKEGIHFATQQKLIDALEDIDKIHEKGQKIKEYTKPENQMGLTTYQGLQEKKFLDDSQFD
ncbi:unnamed protein product [Paramecium sonneborni]|uniref:EF-hand domain-containing protein n=1 Tax=Paramecium sonneborni TaxID=65129 RepID=A0A8S1M2A9_9CILI|nr:unnamed protein product [Paramecium sonneborni]